MEKTEFLLRPARSGDEGPVKFVVYKVLQEFGLQPDPSGVDSDLEDLPKHYSSGGNRFLVLEHHGEIVGCGGLGRGCSGLPEIRKMYLLKPYRGLGFGKKILLSLIEEAKNQGASTVTLETASVLKDAISLYERTGFVPFPCDHLPARCDLAMKLDLEQFRDY